MVTVVTPSGVRREGGDGVAIASSLLFLKSGGPCHSYPCEAGGERATSPPSYREIEEDDHPPTTITTHPLLEKVEEGDARHTFCLPKGEREGCDHGI